MIRKSKNNEDKPDFEKMWSEVEENIQETDAEQDIVNRVPELKQLSIDIDKATTAVINAKLSLESSIRQTQREEGVLGAAVNTISKKVDSINEHIDQVLEDAPTKLQVTVTVCDADWQKMQELHNQWMEQEKQMLADYDKQQAANWQKHSQRLTDIVKNNEGVWISTKLFYIVGSLSLLSIITIVLEIAFYVYFHWIQ
ncbi:MAG: hypothetical protein IJR02_11215 [Bacteroidaceae bacterium]|jgi:hypothetical protein|nr:hypothetical protein [Bacteroidaceae bacterium]